MMHDVEISIIGAALIDPACVPLIVGELAEEHFTLAEYIVVFRTIKQLYEAGKTVDFVTVESELQRRGELDAAGGLKTLLDAMSFVPTTANTSAYITDLQDTHARRLFESGMQQAISACIGGEADYLERAQAVIDGANASGALGAQPVGEYAVQSIIDLGNVRDYLPTGFPSLDNACGGGFHGGDLIILGARPSVGKTSLALNIAANMAVKGKVTAVFSLEMSREQLSQRVAFSISHVSREEALRDSDKAQRLLDAGREMEGMPLYIFDRGNMSFRQIRAATYRLKQRHGCSFIVVDYLGLLQVDRRKNGTREQEIAELSRGFKVLAREMNCPVLLLSQLNRGMEYRGDDAVPGLADLRESGAIEQDADMVLLLYRESKAQGRAKMRIAKNRNGETGYLELSWCGEHFLFRSIGRAVP